MIVFSCVAAFTSKLVAQRRKASNEIADLNTQLELRVQQRTAELKDANRHLQGEIEARRRIQQELARSNSELEHFAYVFSHDVLVPLRAITASAGELRLRQNQEDGELAGLVNHIQLTSEHIEAFISAALSFARVNSQRAIIAVEVSMEATLEWALLNLKTILEQSHASITYDPLPKVRGDQAQIANVLQNLISNAIKYRGSEPPRAHVSARQINDQWLFAVADNGIGIPPESHKSVFEMFTRLHQGHEYPGSGSVSRSAVKSSNNMADEYGWSRNQVPARPFISRWSNQFAWGHFRRNLPRLPSPRAHEFRVWLTSSSSFDERAF